MPAPHMTLDESHPSGIQPAPHTGRTPALSPHSGLQNPGKVYFLDGSPSLAGSVGPSLLYSSGQPLGRTAPPPPQLLGLRVEGLEVQGPPSPLPGQASTPWLPQPTAAEFNEGSGWVPAPQATENCNLASSSTRPEPHLYIEASQRHGGPPSPSTPALVHFPQAWIRPRQLGGGGARGARGPGRGAQASKALVLSAQALPRGPC